MVPRESGQNSMQRFHRGPYFDGGNAYAERFVRSIKQECLGRVIPLGERHCRHIVFEYVAHYHHERNHQGLGNTLIDGIVPNRRQDRIRRRSRLGGSS
jgi:putative transposase